MLYDKRLLKVDAEKIRNLLTSQQSDLISDGAASSKKDLLKPKIQPDIISEGAASLIQKLQQKLEDVKIKVDFLTKFFALLSFELLSTDN